MERELSDWMTNEASAEAFDYAVAHRTWELATSASALADILDDASIPFDYEICLALIRAGDADEAGKIESPHQAVLARIFDSIYPLIVGAARRDVSDGDCL